MLYEVAYYSDFIYINVIAVSTALTVCEIRSGKLKGIQL
jgi:hypothetical protein